jgi:hypothetical protein
VFLHVFGRHWIEGNDYGTTLFEPLDYGDRPRVSHIVGPGFKRESEDGYPLPGDINVAVEQRKQAVRAGGSMLAIQKIKTRMKNDSR